jgi:hypothetical protein
LWIPAALQNYPDAKMIIEISPTEKRQAIGLPISESYENQAIDLHHFKKQLRSWLVNVRHSTYTFLGLCFAPTLITYRIPDVHINILSALFENPTYIELRHWKYVVNLIMRPMILNCPTDCLNVYGDVFAPFLNYLRELLNEKWPGITINTSDAEYVSACLFSNFSV